MKLKQHLLNSGVSSDPFDFSDQKKLASQKTVTGTCSQVITADKVANWFSNKNTYACLGNACTRLETSCSALYYSMYMPLSSVAWECALSSLSLWPRLWSVADLPLASSGSGLSSFSQGGSGLEQMSSSYSLLCQRVHFTLKRDVAIIYI